MDPRRTLASHGGDAQRNHATSAALADIGPVARLGLPVARAGCRHPDVWGDPAQHFHQQGQQLNVFFSVGLCFVAGACRQNDHRLHDKRNVHVPVERHMALWAFFFLWVFKQE